MKIYIGPYLDEKRLYLWEYHLVEKYGLSESIAEKIVTPLQWILDKTYNKFINKMKRNIQITIHDYDTWNADHTLSLIIIPILEKLQEDKQGSPHVDIDDLPDDIKLLDIHSQWNWVLEEMIWAFKENNRHWESDFWVGSPTFVDGKLSKKNTFFDKKGYKEHDRRIQRGLTFFGKYYRTLWS